MDLFLQARLRPALRRKRRFLLALGLAFCWTAAALTGGVILWMQGKNEAVPFPAHTFFAWVVVSLMPAAGLILLWLKAAPDYRTLVRNIEARHPGLNGRLLTATQLERDERGRLNFFQQRLLEETLRHSTQADWSTVVSRRRFASAWILHGTALAAFLTVLILWSSRVDFTPADRTAEAFASEEIPPVPPEGVSVTPGDTLLEKGSSLVVLARFAEPVPATVELIIGDTPETERRLPLTKSLNDPLFGGSVPEVRESLRYRIEWTGGKRSRDFQVTVFEYPRLERPDITLTFPDYTKLPPKRIEDSRRVSAVEGTKIDVDLQLNKPVASAELRPVPAKPDKANPVPPPLPPALVLTADPAAATAKLTGFTPAASQEYQLLLTDSDGRVNQTKQTFRFEVLPNSPPDIRLTTPRGDARPSALEEMVFEGTAQDDFGVLAGGLALTLPGGETQYLELVKETSANNKSAFQHLLRLEDASVQPQDLVTWFVWADDIGPDGQRRRTMGDMFFGEVRLFDEIFREGESQTAEQQQQQQQQEGGGNSPSQKLAELQKQIINATWKLQRTAPPAVTPAFTADTVTVRDSQTDALDQAKEASAEAGGDPRIAAAWSIVTTEMEKARGSLEEAGKEVKALSPALAAEQAAYQALLKVQARETQVSRGQPGSGQGQSSGEQQRQMEMNEMDLTKEENRYETQREAQSPQEEERREQLQVLNRLQELAQRQEDATERLKELQNALEEAKTEEEREEVRRELKRLQEEQREMLADVDELNQRMDKPENRQSMADEKQKLEQTREQMQQAAEAAAQGNVPQAVASGTRAGQQLKEMHDELRRESSSRFAEELRRMRGEARDLERRQEQVAETMKSGGGDEPARGKSLTETPVQEQAIQQLEQQRQRTADLVQRATELSAEAENAEPLVSRQLYDTVRKFSQDDAGGVKQLQEEMLREGTLTRSLYNRMKELQEEEKAGRGLAAAAELLQQELQPEAEKMEQSVSRGLANLREGVERAAESVLGDDTEALKRADRELADLTEQVEQELAQNSAAAGQTGARGEPGDPSAENAARNGDGQTGQEGERESSQEADDSQQSGASGETARNGENSRREFGDANTPGAQSPQTAQQSGNGAAGEPNGEEREDFPSGAGGERQEPGAEVAERATAGGERQGESQDQENPGESKGSQGESQGRETAGTQSGQQPGQSGQEGQQGQGQGQGGGNGGREPQTGQAQNSGGRGGRPGEENDEGERGQRERGGVREFAFEKEPAGGNQRGGGGAANNSRGGRGGSGAPIAGEDYREWSDRLRDVEEIIDAPDLRNGVATARESARRMRVDMKRGDLKKPDWAVVKSEIIQPLAEVRQRLREELARRDSKDALVPIDRDPVPLRYTDLVRRYYKELGGEQ